MTILSRKLIDAATLALHMGPVGVHCNNTYDTCRECRTMAALAVEETLRTLATFATETEDSSDRRRKISADMLLVLADEIEQSPSP